MDEAPPYTFLGDLIAVAVPKFSDVPRRDLELLTLFLYYEPFALLNLLDEGFFVYDNVPPVATLGFVKLVPRFIVCINR